ncbi:MAG TPA: zinc ribbon domain-containing protein [candidate division Zixibacteria bacterium]|nr:zinc ribbon domain-containing protein [candidate division Zixibacteria bacterium]
MPTYQYICVDCGHEFEEFQSMTEDPLDKCPQCGGAAQRRISGGAGLLFKGSGFYTTDYRSDSYKSAAKGESKSDSKGDSKSDTKSGPPEKKSGAANSKPSGAKSDS